jgi:hypothetical protein
MECCLHNDKPPPCLPRPWVWRMTQGTHSVQTSPPRKSNQTTTELTPRRQVFWKHGHTALHPWWSVFADHFVLRHLQLRVYSESNVSRSKLVQNSRGDDKSCQTECKYWRDLFFPFHQERHFWLLTFFQHTFWHILAMFLTRKKTLLHHEVLYS